MDGIKLNTGRPIPIIGYVDTRGEYDFRPHWELISRCFSLKDAADNYFSDGTYKISDKAELHTGLDAALATGYRLIDTATYYNNEADIGESLKELLPKYGLSREDIFVTSKLGVRDFGDAEKVNAGCLASLEKLQLDYLDLYLIHYPSNNPRQPKDPTYPQQRRETWKVLERLHKEGKLRAIGISNYTERHIDELLGYCEIKPAVLQVEFHPHLYQRELVEYCRKNEIMFQAYSSLGHSATNSVVAEPKVIEIATKFGKSPAQVLLRWAVQQNIGCLPKSTKPHRIVENFGIFDFSLSDEDMGALNALNKNARYTWFGLEPGEVL